MYWFNWYSLPIPLDFVKKNSAIIRINLYIIPHGHTYLLYPAKLQKLNEEKPYETILKQLGGNKFIAMTGAKNLGTSTKKDLSFSIGSIRPIK